jgi:hypothetical protein
MCARTCPCLPNRVQISHCSCPIGPGISYSFHPAQDVGVFVIAPAAALAAEPLEHAVALLSLAEAAEQQAAGGVRLPAGAGRLAVSVDGTESDEQIAALKVGRAIRPALSRFDVRPGQPRGKGLSVRGEMRAARGNFGRRQRIQLPASHPGLKEWFCSVAWKEQERG